MAQIYIIIHNKEGKFRRFNARIQKSYDFIAHRNIFRIFVRYIGVVCIGESQHNV